VVQMVVNGGSRLLIFVPRGAHRHDLSFRLTFGSGKGTRFSRSPDGW